MNYNDGLGLLLINFAGPILLGLLLAWGGYQTYLWRRRRGLPVDARPASPYEAAVNVEYGQGYGDGGTSPLVPLGLLVLATFIFIAIVLVTHIGRSLAAQSSRSVGRADPSFRPGACPSFAILS